MLNKKLILALSSLAFIYTSAYAQDYKDSWRNSPLTTKNSNEWRKKPYGSKTYDSWRNLPQSARQSQSKMRWNKDKWQKSSTNWRNRPDVKKPMDSGKWQHRWDKKKWRESPLNWRSSELQYKNSIEKSEGRAVSPEVREWTPSDREVDKTTISEGKREFVKPQSEIVDEKVETISEEAFQYSGNTENYFIVYNGENPFKIEKNVQKQVHLVPGGQIEIYSSSSENH